MKKKKQPRRPSRITLSRKHKNTKKLNRDVLGKSKSMLGSGKWMSDDQLRIQGEFIKSIMEENSILKANYGYDELYYPLSLEEQYNHEIWQKKSLEIIQRDGWVCRYCGSSDKQLRVRPLHNPKGYVWNMDNKSLMIACDDCYEILRYELPELAGIIADKILTGEIDLSTLNLKP